MSRPIKVLYSTHASNLTGASRSLLEMINGMPKDKVEPTVLLRKSGPLKELLDDYGIANLIVPSALTARGPQSNYPVWVMEMTNNIAIKRITRLIKEREYDLVHNNSLLTDVGMRAARRVGIPYVCHVRELVAEDHGLVFCNESRIKDLIRHAATNVFISDFVSKKFEKWVQKTPQITLYNGIETDHYLIPKHKILQNDTVTLLLAGRFQPTKGQLDAIKAIELLHDSGFSVRLFLVGSIGHPHYYDECVDYIHQHCLDDIVVVKDFCDNLGPFRSFSDISLVCSHCEAMGRVTIEGMLSGCLVVAADSGATSYLVRDRVNGRLYSCGNPESLARCIENVLSNKDASRMIAERARDWAKKNFDNIEYSRSVTDLYMKILNNRDVE